MQIHTSSAHTISKCESFQHLSPQAQEALLSLKKIRNIGCEKKSDLIDVKKITTNNHDNPSNVSEVHMEQVVKHPPQNEFMGSQNFSFIQNSKQLLAFRSSLAPDDPTPDFSDALSSERKQICETAQNQQFFPKQLKPMQTLQSQDLNQLNKYIKKPTQEKENKINHLSKNNYHLNRLSDLISKEITKNNQPQTSNNIRKNSHTSINTHNTSQTKCNISTQQDYLYQKAIFQQEKLKTFIEKGQIMNNVKEMKECTFNPKINQKSKIINSSIAIQIRSQYLFLYGKDVLIYLMGLFKLIEKLFNTIFIIKQLLNLYIHFSYLKFSPPSYCFVLRTFSLQA